QILYPTRNPHLRRAALADFDGICGEKTLTLSATDKVDPNYIAFLFQSPPFITYATSRMIGSTNPHIRWRDVADFVIELPPYPQQQRTAAVLKASEEVIHSYRCYMESAVCAIDELADWLLGPTMRSQHPSCSLGECFELVSEKCDPK